MKNGRDKKEVEKYLLNYGATDEEAKCVRMWVKDGHSVYENDYPGVYQGSDSEKDFLSVSRFVCSWNDTYTDSFYDTLTQEYIRKLNPTRYERRKLREHIRNGGRFQVPHVHVGEMVDFITHIRTYMEDMTSEFDSDFGQWILKYGAEYLVSRHYESDFIRFLESKEDYIRANTPCEKSTESDGDLPF